MARSRTYKFSFSAKSTAIGAASAAYAKQGSSDRRQADPGSGDAHPCTISCKNAIRVQIGAVSGRAAVASAPQSLPTAPKTIETCYIIDSSTCGNGFFAAREIAQGELIISEQVIASLPSMDLDEEPTFLEALQSLDDAVKMFLLEMIARTADPDKISYSMLLKTIDDFNRALAEDAVGFAPYLL
ncbi:hypothetical protein LTR10_009572 [Elasticomyces elasticus]|nr:hypothetical protein LTR10_009572 [Elasticomyces elasticus]KAK4971333.1 hypothetical protein LTR42_007059 [Elasticomyces elasticus]